MLGAPTLFSFSKPETEGMERSSASSRRRHGPESPNPSRKRRRISPPAASDGNEVAGNPFDWIPDDILLIILSNLSSTATSPSDFINALSSCKRFRCLCLSKWVLSKASSKMLCVKAKNWCDFAHRFLWRCSQAGNLDACYVLGMIRFYCLGFRVTGVSLIVKAAIGFHAPALYSLAVILFNGSGGSKRNKDLRAGVAFCARAAALGHLEALREFGHCLQDGYGVPQSLVHGRRCLIHASCREIGKTPAELHPANLFMAEWFSERMTDLERWDLRICSNKACGRAETRAYEFRRCSLCGTVNYCSRSCQAIDWKMSHKANCAEWYRGQILAGDGAAVAGVLLGHAPL